MIIERRGHRLGPVVGKSFFLSVLPGEGDPPGRFLGLQPSRANFPFLYRTPSWIINVGGIHDLLALYGIPRLDTARGRGAI